MAKCYREYKAAFDKLGRSLPKETTAQCEILMDCNSRDVCTVPGPDNSFLTAYMHSITPICTENLPVHYCRKIFQGIRTDLTERRTQRFHWVEIGQCGDGVVDTLSKSREAFLLETEAYQDHYSYNGILLFLTTEKVGLLVLRFLRLSLFHCSSVLSFEYCMREFVLR